MQNVGNRQEQIESGSEVAIQVLLICLNQHFFPFLITVIVIVFFIE